MLQQQKKTVVLKQSFSLSKNAKVVGLFERQASLVPSEGWVVAVFRAGHVLILVQQ